MSNKETNDILAKQNIENERLLKVREKVCRTEYKIVTGVEVADFAMDINYLLQEDWFLHGETSISAPDIYTVRYCQAMTRVVSDE